MELLIKESGSCIYADTDGYLISDTEIENIQNKWLLIAERFREEIVKILEKNLVSIFLRGSGANGTAIDNMSDIDLLVVTMSSIDEYTKSKILTIGNNLNREAKFITRFDVGFYNKQQILCIKERVLIKLRSVCIYGEDLSKEIINLKPGKDISITLPKLESEIRKVQDDIKRKVYTPGNTPNTCKWMMKMILRAGFELVSERESCYTRDLYQCWDKFSKYYPNYKEEMYQVLYRAINPSTDIEEIKKFFLLATFITKEARANKLL